MDEWQHCMRCRRPRPDAELQVRRRWYIARMQHPLLGFTRADYDSVECVDAATCQVVARSRVGLLVGTDWRQVGHELGPLLVLLLALLGVVVWMWLS